MKNLTITDAAAAASLRLHQRRIETVRLELAYCLDLMAGEAFDKPADHSRVTELASQLIVACSIASIAQADLTSGPVADAFEPILMDEPHPFASLCSSTLDITDSGAWL